MCNKRLLAVCVLAFVSSSWQASTPTTPYYTAGVVEFSSSSKVIGRLEDNLADYLKIITSDEAADTDIIVFPEATLNSPTSLTSVPDPATKTAPCDQSEYASFLQQLSCQARASKKYIVINLTEMEKCTVASQAAINDPRKCALYGYNTYNTHVVFDRNGTVVSRYRKYNLYYEPWNVTHTPEYGRFDTDFGVTFGHFICFDILFYTPTTELVKQGITDFIFSSMWFSELPFLTAAQEQQSWAYSYNVTLLAAGASNPSSGSTGSGIYVGRDGPLVTVMSSVKKRQIYVAQVPKRGFAKQQQSNPPQLRIRQKRTATSYIQNIKVKRDEGINNFTTEPIELVEGTVKKNVCNGDFCCSFQYSVSKNTPPAGSLSYQYRLGAFDGDRIYTGIDPLGWSMCTVMACVNGTLEGCGLTFDNDSLVSPAFKFETMSISAYFDKTENALVMPNSVDRDLLPLPVKDFDFSVTNEKNNKLLGKMDLKTPNGDLLNFGIYVSYFGDRSSAYSVLVSKLLIVILSCALLLS